MLILYSTSYTSLPYFVNHYCETITKQASWDPHIGDQYKSINQSVSIKTTFRLYMWKLLLGSKCAF